MSKFLTYEDRLVIAQLLQENVSFGVIGKKLGKDRTTIAKEIKKHSYDKKSGDRKSTRLNSSHPLSSRMPSSA